MSNLQVTQNSAPAGTPSLAGSPMFTAMVTGQEEQWLTVQCNGQNVRARLAASCLLAPQVGDLVLLYSTEQQKPLQPAMSVRYPLHIQELPAHCYILSVLVQASPELSRIALPGDTELTLTQGQLCLNADSIALKTRKSLSLQAPLLDVQSAHANLKAHQLDATATLTVARLGELRLFARNMWTTASRVIQKMRSSTRHVEELDNVQAGRARWDVQGHAQLNAQRASIQAKDAVRIDGSRVDLG